MKGLGTKLIAHLRVESIGNFLITLIFIVITLIFLPIAVIVSQFRRVIKV